MSAAWRIECLSALPYIVIPSLESVVSLRLRISKVYYLECPKIHEENWCYRKETGDGDLGKRPSLVFDFSPIVMSKKEERIHEMVELVSSISTAERCLLPRMAR
jgi:hypothetical protein